MLDMEMSTDMTITQKIDDLAAELKQVNFADSKDAVGFLEILFPLAAEAGLDKFKPNWQSPEIQQVVKIARSWVNAAKAHIPQMTAGDALEMLSAYDFLCCTTNLLPDEKPSSTSNCSKSSKHAFMGIKQSTNIVFTTPSS